MDGEPVALTMRMTAAGAAKSFLRAAGYYRRKLRAATFPGPLVLCYHNILPDDIDRSTIPFAPLHVSASRLDEHCRAIRETCHPIRLETFADRIAGDVCWPK